MNNYDLALINATVIDEHGKIYHEQSLGIKDGKIAYFGNKIIEATKIINCKNKVITPTFANGHVHSPMNLLKGIAEDVSIDAWFNERIWPYESSLIPKDIEVGAKLGIYEMINNGISVFAEHYFMEDQIIKAVKDTKIRIDLAPTIFSGDDFNTRVQTTLDLANKYQDSEHINITFGPHSPYLCTPEDLVTIAKKAKEHNMKIHLHIGETNTQLLEHKEKYNETPMETLERCNVLDLDLILAHSLHFEKNDLKLLKNNHFIPLSSKTYMKLAMDLNLMINNIDNFNWGFGTDGAASSNTLDVIEQARLLGLSSKDKLNDSTAMPLKTIWQRLMSTHNIFKFKTGKISIESKADLIIWDLNKLNTLPNYNLLASIIYSSNSENIESVLINGVFVKKDGKVLGFDKDFIDEVVNHKNRLLKAGKGKSSLKF